MRFLPFIVAVLAAPAATFAVNSDVLITGQDPASRFGTSVACGDVNDDGIDDLLVGADLGSVPDGDGFTRGGEVYVFYGSSQHSVILDLTVADPDLTISGLTQFDLFGHAVTARDISGDGIDDIIAVTRFGLPSERDGAGEVHVLFGRADFLPNQHFDLSVGLGDIRILGAGVRDETGFALATGDLNDDGTADLILGAPGYPGLNVESYGKVYVFFGGSIPTGTTIDLALESADIEITGQAPASALGASLSVGDLNNDTVDDLIVGASRSGGGAGKIHVFFGGALGSGTVIDLATTVADIEINGENGLGYLGVSTATGRIDDDLIDDLVVSAHNSAAGFGRVYVIHGGSLLSGTVINLQEGTADLVITGDDLLGLFGWRAATGDYNGDGAEDLVVGSTWADDSGQADVGKVHVFHGPLGTGALAAAAADQIIIGAAETDEIGFSLAFGDTNDDGAEDLFVGAPRANGRGTLYGFRGASQANAAREVRLSIARFAGLPHGLSKKPDLPPAFD